MQIHVVQEGETVGVIADYYGVTVEKLIRDNDVTNAQNLVVGQSLVIAIPEVTYAVRDGDTLQGIADIHQVSVMQLYQNNPFLSEREYLYPGETIVISYANTMGRISIHSNAFPYINITILEKTLPYLTYLSIINYTATTEGEIRSFYDDSDVVQIAKDYHVMPLMLLTTLTLQGEANIQITYELLINEDFQNKQIDNILRILRDKGYYGVNISIQYVNTSTIGYYEKYLTNVFNRLSQEGYYLFITLTPGISMVDGEIFIDQVNFSTLNKLASNIIFMNLEWSTNLNAPSPIFSVNGIKVFLEYVSSTIYMDSSILGVSTIGYDWELPYIAGNSSVRSLTINNAIALASGVGAVIRFDEPSQTPYYVYTLMIEGNPIQHVVWFVDARSINSILDLATQYKLQGVDIWNIMNYDAQLWLVVNTQYEIVKVL